MPETWLELLTFLRELSHSPQAAQYCVRGALAEGNSALAEELFAALCESQLRRTASGAPADFDDPDFRALTAAYREIDFAALRFEQRMLENPDGSVSQEAALMRIGQNNLQFFADAHDRNLKLREQDAPIGGYAARCAFVDPDSERKEAAFDCIRVLIEADAESRPPRRPRHARF